MSLILRSMILIGLVSSPLACDSAPESAAASKPADPAVGVVASVVPTERAPTAKPSPAEPVKAEPAKVESAKATAEPVKAEPAKAEPAKAASALFGALSDPASAMDAKPDPIEVDSITAQFPDSSLVEVVAGLAPLERVEREHLERAFPKSTIRGDDDRLTVSEPDGHEGVYISTHESVVFEVWINSKGTKVHGFEVGDRFGDLAEIEDVQCEIEAGESYLVRCGPPDGWRFSAFLPRSKTPPEGSTTPAKAMALAKRKRINTIDWRRPGS